MTNQADAVRVEKRADRETRLQGTFAVAPKVLFDAITRPEHLRHWLSASPFTLAEVHVDGRPGGTFRYVYKRPNGHTIEVRGAYKTFDPPRGYEYLESYDFSPLQIDVTVFLEETNGGTRFTQLMRYVSTAERDDDFVGVATSSRGAYSKLAQYLKSLHNRQGAIPG